MAFACGSLTAPGSTGQVTYSPTNLTFTPKALLLFGLALTGDGSSPGAILSIGMAVSSTSRAHIVYGLDDAAATSNTKRRHDNTKVFAIMDASGTLYDVADFVSFGSGGSGGQFTLNWTAITNSWDFHWIALGGSDISNAAIKELTCPTSTGNVAYTGVGFKPDALIAISAGYQTAPPSSADDAISSIGFYHNAAYGEVNISSNDNQVAADSNQSQRADHLLDITDSGIGAGFQRRHSMAVVSLDADGFTLNHDNVTATADYVWVLCLKGGQYKVGSFTEKTSDGTQAVTGVGFTPRGLFMISGGRAANGDFSTGSCSLAFGMVQNTSARATGWVGETAAADPSVADRYQESDKMIALVTEGTPTVVGAADISSFDSNGFTPNWTSTDGTARIVFYMAFGDGAGTGGGGGGQGGGRSRGGGGGGSGGGGTGGNPGQPPKKTDARVFGSSRKRRFMLGGF